MQTYVFKLLFLNCERTQYYYRNIFKQNKQRNNQKSLTQELSFLL